MIRILTDGGSDLTRQLAEKYQIEVLPIPVNDGENEYLGDELSSDKLFSEMKRGKVYKTSQVPVGIYEQSFRKFLENGDDIIYISLSSGVTATYDSACSVRESLLKEFPEAKIYVLDSFCATWGLGLVAIRAAKMVIDNLSYDEIIRAIEFYKIHQQHIFSVMTLDFLIRGGRLSKTAGVIGGLLKLMPIIEIEKSLGKLQKLDKAKGEKNLFKKLIEKLDSYNNFNPNQTMVISYGENNDIALRFKSLLVKHYNIDEKNILIEQLGAVIGAHTGPDFLGIFFLDELYNEYNIL